MSKQQVEKDSFVFYCDWIDHLSLLDPAEAVAVLRSVRNYITEGQSDVLHGAAAMAFSFIRAQLDRDQTKWKEVRAQRAEAGRAGAEATNAKRQKSAKAANADFAEQGTANPAVPVPVPVPVPEPVNDSGCTADKPRTRSRFVPPTLEQVAEYVKQRNSHVDPQGFIDFYDAKGWMIGKTPMKDWKAACRNAESWERWDRRENGGKKDAGSAKPFAGSNTGTSADKQWNLKSAFDD